MKDSETLNIIEINRLSRNKTSIQTVNKSCDALSCRLKGKSSFYYNNKKYTLERGDLLYIPSGSNYVQETDGEEIICFHLESSNLFKPVLQVCRFENPDRICELFKQAYSIWNQREHNYRYFAMSDLYKIIAMSDISFSLPQKVCPKIIQKSVEYLKKHLYDVSLSIDAVCKESSISRVYFNRIFKEHYSCTPIKYINNARINKCKRLLVTGMYTHQEIAILCGFNNLKYLYTLFKKHTGLTMKEYLSSVHNAE